MLTLTIVRAASIIGAAFSFALGLLVSPAWLFVTIWFALAYGLTAAVVTFRSKP